jgi:hypothetical protein
MKEKKQYFYSRTFDVMLYYISLPISHNVDTICAVVVRRRLYSGQRLVAGCCECGNEPSGSIKCRVFLD